MEPEIPVVRKQVLSKICDNAVESQNHLRDISQKERGEKD